MKRKININRPQISSDEINQRKDFDSVLKAQPQAGKPFFKKPWFLSSVLVATIAIVTTVALLNQKGSVTDQKEVIAVQPEFQRADSLGQERSCIAPPLSGLNVNYSVYKIDADKGGEIHHVTGSVVKVPALAFTDENGNSVKGEVEIRYREFHDVVDIFVAGIPMTYDSAGVRYHFESAGMLQIEGYQNGKKINIAPEKKLDVKMVSNDDSPKYNLYELDTLKNNWACLGKDKIVKNGDEKNNAKIEVKKDFKDSMPSFGQQEAIIKKERDQKIAALPDPVLIAKKPVKANPAKYTFDISVDPKEFPELSVYKGMLFEVGAENKAFNKSYYDVEWEDASIKDGTKKGENYSLSLKKGKESLNLIVYPVFEGKNYEAAMKVYQEKFDKYTTALNKRKEEEIRIEEDYKAKIAAAKKKEEETIAKLNKAEENRFKQLETQQKVFRAFTVSNFGVYNCDNPMKYPSGASFTANLITEKNKKLDVYDVYLVDKAINGMFSFYKNPVTKFTYNPGANNILWTVESGVLYYLQPEDFKNMKQGSGMVDITMKRVEQKFQNIDEMKAFFNI